MAAAEADAGLAADLSPVTAADASGLALAVSASSANGGTLWQDGSTGDWWYASDPSFAGSDAVTFSATDANGLTATATTLVTVDPPPTAADVSASVYQGSAAGTIDVLANDTGTALRVGGVDGASAAGGSVTTDGACVYYTPAAGFTGADWFGYTATDGNGGSASAAVYVTVLPNPTANADGASAVENSSADALDVLANDTDPNGYALTIDGVDGGSASGGSVWTDGAYVYYTPAVGFTGNDQFSYSITNGCGGGASAAVFVAVNPVL